MFLNQQSLLGVKIKSAQIKLLDMHNRSRIFRMQLLENAGEER